eukprot:8472694-Ditylum_brightwellii.AAC.1
MRVDALIVLACVFSSSSSRSNAMNSSDAIAVNCHFSNGIHVFMPFTVRLGQLRFQAQLELNNPKSVTTK